jgi:Restriction endonuclease
MMDDRSGRGAQFEARVASLLRSSPGYRDIREQQHIKGKDVDIIFRKQWNPHKYITIAVECKNWKRGVDRASVQSIYLDHKPLLDAKDIDELWIVTPHPVASTVQEYADSFDHLEVLHINEFEQDVIDFSIYTSHLIKRFSQDKLSQYYIPSRLEHSDVTLHERVMAWLESPSNKPIAVWAG